MTLADEFQMVNEAALVPPNSGYARRIGLLDLPEHPGVGEDPMAFARLAILDTAYQQLCRVAILARFAQERSIQFPPSIRLANDEQHRRCSAASARTRDFHPTVRDASGATSARAHLDCPVYLIPDMALFLPPLARLPATRDVVCLPGLPKFFFSSRQGKASTLYRSGTYRRPLARVVESPKARRAMLAEVKA